MSSPTRHPPQQAIGTAPAFVPSGFVIRRIVNPITVRRGASALVVRGRRSGRPITTPVPPFEFEGAKYLVGGRGETHLGA